MDKELQKAKHAYDKAWAKLITERDRVFPVGTKVITIKHGIEMNYTVTGGSRYADQILLDGHSHHGFHGIKLAPNTVI